METATLTFRNKTYEVAAGMTIRDALKKIGLAPEATLAVYEGKLLTDDQYLKPGMKIKLVAVVSGGAL